MEAKWLFDVDLDQIQVVIQPQSIIHSMVQYQRRCGDRTAWHTGYEASDPVCAVSIQSAEYLAGERLDFWSLSQITFEKPDMENFRRTSAGLCSGKSRRLHADSI